MIFLKKYYFNTTTNVDCLAVTHELRYAIRDAGIENGVAYVCVPKPGAAVLIGESQQEAVEGMLAVFEAWRSQVSQEEMRDHWQRNVAVLPRVQSAILGRSIHVPFAEGRLCLDAYSDVLLCDLENEGLRREVIIQVMGDGGGGQEQPQPQEQMMM